jgi:serine/threonine-protein kinase
MTTDTATWVGQTLSGDRYQVTAKLGEGGMGLVYRALDRRLDAEVVIKVPRRAMLDDPAFAGRFAREVRSLVQLVHPHIVKVMDAGEHDGLPFAVMQYLPGGSLRDRQPAGPGGERLPLPGENLRAWLGAVADALDFIHRKGYVHRDVKPDNILFDAEGHAHLSDFGVAKVLPQEGRRKKNTALTGAGMILGTPHFMAPELILGQPVDGRVDQYALAVMVYELLSGRYPFDGDTPITIYVQHTTEEPVPLERALPGVPEGLASAVRKALAKEPGERYADCASFARAALAAFGAAAVPQQARAAGTAVTLVCPGCRKPFARPATAERLRCPSCGKARQVSSKRHRPAPTGRADKPRAGTGTVAASGPPPVTRQGEARQGGTQQASRAGIPRSTPPVAELVPPAQEIIRPQGQSLPGHRPAARRPWPWLLSGVTGLLLIGLLLSALFLAGRQPGAVEVARKQDRREPPVARPPTTDSEKEDAEVARRAANAHSTKPGEAPSDVHNPNQALVFAGIYNCALDYGGSRNCQYPIYGRPEIPDALNAEYKAGAGRIWGYSRYGAQAVPPHHCAGWGKAIVWSVADVGRLDVMIDVTDKHNSSIIIGVFSETDEWIGGLPGWDYATPPGKTRVRYDSKDIAVRIENGKNQKRVYLPKNARPKIVLCVGVWPNSECDVAFALGEPPVAKPTTTGGESKPSSPTETTGAAELPVTGAGKNPVDSKRKAAAWIYQLGSSLNGTASIDDLLAGPFEIQNVQLQGSINVPGSTRVTDEGLANLQGLPYLHTLNLSGSGNRLQVRHRYHYTPP